VAVGFSTDVTFKVRVDDEARIPHPVPATDSDAESYQATILLDTYADYLTLRSYVSGVNLIPAMGGGGLVQVTRGRGTRTLTIPISSGGEVSYRAVLIAISPLVYKITDSNLQADVEFLILELSE
jgi:hypothetical protein